MKKRNLNSLRLNKKSIAGFANALHGGQASNSGLNVTCPNICIATKKGILCEEIEFPPLEAAPVPKNPASDEAAAGNAAADSQAG